MKLDPIEEKSLRVLVEKDTAGRPIFLTQEEGKKLFEELDFARKLASEEVKRSESLVRKYKDDQISQSIEQMLSEISGLYDEKIKTKRFLITANSMLQRASRISCSEGSNIFSSSKTHSICEHCEILKHLVEMMDKVEKSIT